MFSVAMDQEINAKAKAHLLRDDGDEDLCFALWYPSHGATRTSAVISELVLPHDGDFDRRVHGNV